MLSRCTGWGWGCWNEDEDERNEKQMEVSVWIINKCMNELLINAWIEVLAIIQSRNKDQNACNTARCCADSSTTSIQSRWYGLVRIQRLYNRWQLLVIIDYLHGLYHGKQLWHECCNHDITGWNGTIRISIPIKLQVNSLWPSDTIWRQESRST